MRYMSDTVAAAASLLYYNGMLLFGTTKMRNIRHYKLTETETEKIKYKESLCCHTIYIYGDLKETDGDRDIFVLSVK